MCPFGFPTFSRIRMARTNVSTRASHTVRFIVPCAKRSAVSARYFLSVFRWDMTRTFVAGDVSFDRGSRRILGGRRPSHDNVLRQMPWCLPRGLLMVGFPF